MHILEILLMVFILGAAAVAYRHFALKKKILDIPSERSSHTVPVIRGGGIVFVLAVLAAVVKEAFSGISPSAIWFLAGFILLSATGFADDRKSLSPWIRFPFQLIAIGPIFTAAGLWQADFPWWIKAAAYIVALGFVNAYNFMDGINGITGLYSIVLILTLWYLNRLYALVPDTIFLYLLIALLIFGFFNFRKQALMFAGDVGSMSLAAVLLFLLSKFMIELKSPALLLTVAVYGTDSAMTIILRLWRKQNVFQAHRWHVYQKLVDRYRWKHMSVAFMYALLQAVINFWVIFYKLYERPLKTQWTVLFLVLIGLILFYIYFQKDKWFGRALPS